MHAMCGESYGIWVGALICKKENGFDKFLGRTLFKHICCVNFKPDFGKDAKRFWACDLLFLLLDFQNFT